MTGTVITLPRVCRDEADEARPTPVQVRLSRSEYKWLREVAASWKVEPQRAAHDLLVTAIREAAGKSTRR
jgi:hypothetical protein